jgi:hypothetical protein
VTIIKAVLSSAAKAELGALYLNAKEAVYLRQILIKMGHPQPCTPIQTDNTTAEGVIHNEIRPKRTKAMDMQFHLLRYRGSQQQFKFNGSHGREIWWIILQNTTHLLTTPMSEQNS